MKPDEPLSDAELDRLLASRLRRTSPEFELRWRALRSELTSAGVRRPTWASRWLLWPGLATAALAAVMAVFALRSPPPPLGSPAVSLFEELIALDAALAPAAPLLDAENRDAVLYLQPSSNL
jgi:hypothetical protein